MARPSLKETDTFQEKKEIIKTAYPKMFNHPNMLAMAVNTAEVITSPERNPYNFDGRTTAVTPFNKFSFKYETYETIEQSSMKGKWRLHIGFAKKNDELHSNNNFVLLYMGDVDSKTLQPQPANKLFLHFLLTKTRVIFDLKDRKIGFADASDKISYKIEDYSTVIDLDQIANSANQEPLLSKFNENSPIKIYGIEVDQEKNIAAFRCKGGLFGRIEHNITLPLKMEVKPDKSFDSQSINILDNQLPFKHTQGKKSVSVDINGINLKINSAKNSKIIAIGELKFSLTELKLLYYKYVLQLDNCQLLKIINVTHDFIEIGLIKRNYAFICQKDESTKPILILKDEANKLGILNEDFFKNLAEELIRVKALAWEKK